VDSRSHQGHAPVCIRLGPLTARNTPGIFPPDRSPRPGALWDDRDAHEHFQSLRWGPGARLRRATAARRRCESHHPETGAIESTPGAIGTLEIKGPNVFAGYWRDEAKTRSEFTADGWFKTGDLGRIDSNGYVYIVGRVKDLVITGGYNVYPKEVETELDAVPGVSESAVFGVAHPDFGEGVTAAVVLGSGATLSESDILHSVRSRLAGYKCPKRIIFVAELPRNTMGKVQKNLLRATHAGLYAANDRGLSSR